MIDHAQIDYNEKFLQTQIKNEYYIKFAEPKTL